MSKCWKCNKEFYSENLIRTLCDECLEKIPKTTATTDFGNLLNSEIKDLVDDFSKRKISELEAKLAKEKEYTQQYRKECAKIQTDYYELKQQLAEKEVEIKKLNACVDFYKSYSVSFQEKVIDELERVKEKILPKISSYVKKEFVVKEFDNQIKRLKEMK